ncbi:TnpV protein [Enterococcus mediterraneensis]|uniref:TnpV protein n=1 Tax=Enterococcus mediterraneensis TaxID=2364791 RepID=UPI000F05F304|nr:TnpV protein [Enterococcus mediterraneensis]
MGKSLFEQMGGTYHEESDYLIPNLALPAEEEKSIGVWGRRHLRYLKEYRRVTYANLLTSGKLNVYLADIDKQAQERFQMFIEQMKQVQDITEQLKDEKPMEWVQRMNNVRACAMEIVNKEIIYA